MFEHSEGWWSRLTRGARGSRSNQALLSTQTQRLFVEWNAERLGISTQQSQERYQRSWNAVPNGHSGRPFREINTRCHELLQVFFSDNEREAFAAYQAHAPLHFLRMLSYAEPRFEATDPVLTHLVRRAQVTILDFGCGLAQRSRAISAALIEQQVDVKLVLADIPTLRREFLLWLGQRSGIPTTFLACTPEAPIPALPACHLVIATDFFEHVHDPLAYFDRMDQALIPGGLIIADTEDHEHEFMHVSPQLGALRERMRVKRYAALRPGELFRKAL